FQSNWFFFLLFLSSPLFSSQKVKPLELMRDDNGFALQQTQWTVDQNGFYKMENRVNSLIAKQMLQISFNLKNVLNLFEDKETEQLNEDRSDVWSETRLIN